MHERKRFIKTTHCYKFVFVLFWLNFKKYICILRRVKRFALKLFVAKYVFALVVLNLEPSEI